MLESHSFAVVCYSFLVTIIVIGIVVIVSLRREAGHWKPLLPFSIFKKDR